MKRQLRRMAGAVLRLAIRVAGLLFIRGSRLSDAIRTSGRLRARGRSTTLGYFNADNEAPRAVADATLSAVDALAALGTGGYLSIKAPALGYDSGLIGEIVDRAARGGIGVHFDSHATEQAEPTFAAMASALARPSPAGAAPEAGQAAPAPGWSFGCTLPGRWSRSLSDADRAVELGLRVRVVKGQWVDPSAPDIDPRAGFLAVIDRLAGRARSVAVASHDPPLAEEALRRLARTATPHELELLLGLPMQAALRMARKTNATVRVYVPFGVSWLPYALEQFQKRPGIAWWAVRDAMLGRFVAPPPLLPPG